MLADLEAEDVRRDGLRICSLGEWGRSEVEEKSPKTVENGVSTCKSPIISQSWYLSKDIVFHFEIDSVTRS